MLYKVGFLLCKVIHEDNRLIIFFNNVVFIVKFNHQIINSFNSLN